MFTLFTVKKENEERMFENVLTTESWHAATQKAIYEAIRVVESEPFSQTMITSNDDSSLTTFDITKYKTTFDHEWKYTFTEPDETGKAICIMDNLTLLECFERAEVIMRERACTIFCLSADDVEFRASLMILHSK